MKEYFYIDGLGVQKGPIPGEQLRALGVKPNTLVWCDGMPEWLPAAQVVELQVLFQTSSYAQPPFNSNYGYNQPTNNVYDNNITNKPDDYMILGIISTILCSLLGIFSLYFSLKVSIYYNNGEYDRAKDASQKAKILAIIGIVATLLFGFGYFIFIGAIVNSLHHL